MNHRWHMCAVDDVSVFHPTAQPAPGIIFRCIYCDAVQKRKGNGKCPGSRIAKATGGS